MRGFIHQLGQPVFPDAQMAAKLQMAGRTVFPEPPRWLKNFRRELFEK